MKLDSAYCCHSLRNDFLGLLNSEEYFIKEQVTIDIDSCSISMLKRFGKKMRVVEFVDGRRLRSQPVHINLVKAHCHNLTHVDFSCAEVCTSKLWALLKTNPHIECLTMSNGDEDAFDRSFDNIVLPYLNTLVVIDYDLRNKNILGAMKMLNVVRLDLFSCNFVGSVLLEIAALCPRLSAVVLSDLYTQGLTDELLRKFTALCPHIAHIDITNADCVTDAGMLSVVHNLRGL